MKTYKKKKGFTLIELIVVIAILGILAAVLIPKFAGFSDKAKTTQAVVDAKQIATAIDSLIVEGKTTAEITQTVVLDLAQVGIYNSTSGHWELPSTSSLVLSSTIAADGFFVYKVHVGTSDYYAARNTASGKAVKPATSAATAS